jgi:hypothetical protein
VPRAPGGGSFFLVKTDILLLDTTVAIWKFDLRNRIDGLEPGCRGNIGTTIFTPGRSRGRLFIFFAAGEMMLFATGEIKPCFLLHMSSIDSKIGRGESCPSPLADESKLSSLVPKATLWSVSDVKSCVDEGEGESLLSSLSISLSTAFESYVSCCIRGGD